MFLFGRRDLPDCIVERFLAKWALPNLGIVDQFLAMQRLTGLAGGGARHLFAGSRPYFLCWAEANTDTAPSSTPTQFSKKPSPKRVTVSWCLSWPRRTLGSPPPAAALMVFPWLQTLLVLIVLLPPPLLSVALRRD